MDNKTELLFEAGVRIKKIDEAVKYGVDNKIIGREYRRELLKEANELIKTLKFYEGESIDKSMDVFNEWIKYFSIDDIKGQPISEVYDAYAEDSILQGVTPYSKIKFGKLINEKYGFVGKVVNMNGYSVRIYA